MFLAKLGNAEYIEFVVLGAGSRQNGFQEVRFKHFLALGSEIDKMGSRKSDLSIFWHWAQKSTKWAPGAVISVFSGIGSRS